MQGLCLGHAQMGDHVHLPVEVGDVHDIEIDEEKMPHAGPGKADRDVGPQAPQSRDSDRGVLQFFLHPDRKTFVKGTIQFFL